MAEALRVPAKLVTSWIERRLLTARRYYPNGWRDSGSLFIWDIRPRALKNALRNPVVLNELWSVRARMEASEAKGS